MRRRSPGPFACCAALIAALAGAPASAERADRYKPTQVDADRMQYDDLKQVNVFTGTVVLTKGTITLRADRLVLEQDPEGYQHGTATGKLATFRQKRDGLDEWVEGHAETIVYNGRTETVTLTGRAKVRRLEGAKVADEIDGAVIVYDSRTEQFDVDGANAKAQSGSANGRVRVIIAPRVGDPAAGPTPAPGGGALRPATGLAAPRGSEPR